MEALQRKQWKKQREGLRKGRDSKGAEIQRGEGFRMGRRLRQKGPGSEWVGLREGGGAQQGEHSKRGWGVSGAGLPCVPTFMVTVPR